MSYVTPITAVATEPLPAADWNAGVRDNMEYFQAVATPIGETVLGADADGVTFDTFPAWVDSLYLEILGRAAIDGGGSGVATLSVRFNASTTGYRRMYRRHRGDGDSSTFVGVGEDQMRVGTLGSGDGSVAQLYIPAITDTAREKGVRCHVSTNEGTASADQIESTGGGQWNNVNAVTEVLVRLTTADMFRAGTVFRLYGRPGQ